MKKHFNIAGPCIQSQHYMLHFEEKYKEINDLVDSGIYYVLHAARQSGKTTTVQQLTKQINKAGNYYAFYCSLETVQPLPEPERGMPAILACIKMSAETYNLPSTEIFSNYKNEDFNIMIYQSLSAYCKILDKPLIVFFDEADCLSEGTLIIFLRQLRNGFIEREQKPFPQSISLIGMRNLREYKSRYRTSESTGSVSPFNIITKSLTLKNFTYENIVALYKQHTDETEQIFETSAIEKVYYYTSGQPWLVNAIARECIVEILKNDFSKTITAEMVEVAVKNIIIRRDVHIDSLIERLKDERVMRIMQPIILGENAIFDFANDDALYCLDLGLISIIDGELKPSNKIYQEVIIRSLNYSTQFMLQSHFKPIWIVNNKIDMDGLLKRFQQFWRENSQIWIQQIYYTEAAPHLILQAFLQRVINGGGNILREYALGRMRMDICVIYENIKYPIEIKLYYGQKTKKEGLEQLAEYMDSLGESIGWLVIFDRRKNISWTKKITWTTETINNKTIHIVGC